jgi:predicted secreted hydrolase
MSPHPRARSLAVTGLVALGTIAAACDPPGPPRATLSVTRILADADTAGFARADQPRDFDFPFDHGSHPEFRHEWWYFTGNLESDDGRWLAFQLTFFRNALRPGDTELASDWATNQAYMAHFALSDVEAGSFQAFERFERGAVGLAGATATPFRVHVGDWSVQAIPADDAAPAFPSMELRAAAGDVEVSLVLDPAKPVVLQGDGGLSLKGPEPGNASYYYSLTRLAARGTVRVGSAPARVDGWAWLDREWGTSALGPDLEGWDWFSIQMDDHTELMFYRLRRRDGGTDPFSRGSFVHPDGRVTPLQAGDVLLEPTSRWRSPRGAFYPSAWRLRVPRLDLALEIEAAMQDQEIDLSFRYWEGAVAVDGRRAGQGIRGRGYVELTGYADP